MMFALTAGHISAAPFSTNNISLPEQPQAGGQAGTLLPTRLKTLKKKKKSSELQKRESGTKTGVYSYFVPLQWLQKEQSISWAPRCTQREGSACVRRGPGAGFPVQIESIISDIKEDNFLKVSFTPVCTAKLLSGYL